MHFMQHVAVKMKIFWHQHLRSLRDHNLILKENNK